MDKFIKSTGINRLLFFLIVVSIITIFVPLFSTISYFVLLTITTMLGLVLYPQIIKQKPFIFMVLFVVVQFTYALIGKGVTMNSTIMNSMLFLSSIVICYSCNALSQKQANIMLGLLVLLFIYTNVGTFLVLLDNPLAVRNFGYSVESADDAAIVNTYRLRGMFSYAVGEAHAIILPAFLAFFVGCKKKRAYSYFILIVVVGGIIVQLLSALMTSFLLSACFCGLLLFSTFFANSLKKSIGLIVIIVALLIPTWGYIEEFVEYNQVISAKIEDMNDSYSSGHSSGEVEGRTSRYSQSIKVCMQKPIFGLGDTPDNPNGQKEKTVSYHTAFFDYWGLYGVFTIFLLLSWRETIKGQLRLLGKEQKKSYRWCILSLVSLVFLKGPVTIGTNFIFSTVLLGILCANERFNNVNNNAI